MRRLCSALLAAALSVSACQTAPEPAPEMFTMVVAVQHVRATDLAATLTEFLQQDAASGKDDLRVACTEKQNALVVSGSEARVRALLELIAQLDVEAGVERTSQLLHLGNSLAPALQAELRRFLAEEQANASSGS